MSVPTACCGVVPPPPRSTLLRGAWTLFAFKLTLLESEHPAQGVPTNSPASESGLERTAHAQPVSQCSNDATEYEGSDAKLQKDMRESDVDAPRQDCRRSVSRSRSPRRHHSRQPCDESDYDEESEDAQRRW